MTNYTINEAKMFADITDGLAIVINAETGVYYGMNGLGTVVFENLMAGANVADITVALTTAGVEDAENKVKAFVKTLEEKEIIMAGAENSKEVTIAANVASSDNFEMTVDEYSDAQELLLADPIHEVKEDSGWTPEKDSIGYSKEETAEREKKMED